jgi:hypothetical protein
MQQLAEDGSDAFLGLAASNDSDDQPSNLAQNTHAAPADTTAGAADNGAGAAALATSSCGAL